MPVYLRLSTWAEGVVGDKGINGCSAAGGVWCVVYKGVRRDTEQVSIRTRSMDADESRCAQFKGKETDARMQRCVQCIPSWYLRTKAVNGI